jgi:hypothetical protein
MAKMMWNWRDSDEERDCDQAGLATWKLAALLIIAMIIGGTCESRGDEMIRIEVKDGVDLSGLDRRMWNAVGEIAALCFEQFNQDTLVITSGREGKHGSASWHYIGRALDFRYPDDSYKLETDEAQSKRLELRRLVLQRLGSRYQSVAHVRHLHVELERG